MKFTRWITATVFISFACATAVSAQKKPVHFEKLVKVCPTGDDVEGYEASTEGSTTNAFNMHVTEVTCAYKSTSDPTQRVTIKILDNIAVPFANMAQAAVGGMQFAKEDSQGYQKSVKVDGVAGMEEFKKADERGKLSAFDDGFNIEVTTVGLPPEAMQEWFKKVPREEMQKLRQEGDS